MVESIGQFGPGLPPPSSHVLRVPLLEKAKVETNKLKEVHEVAWNQYGCTLMSDGWTDRRGRHLINFLANSPQGTFFLESVDASSQTHDAPMLADLLQKKIDQIGSDKVVQVVTDNGANYKAAGRLLEERNPTLFWTPCAAHCLDLMLEDIGKIPAFKTVIENARRVTTFIYRHAKVLEAMRQKTGGRDLVRPAATRFATAFLTLQSVYKHRDALRRLFEDEEWNQSKLGKTEAWKKCHEITHAVRMWHGIEDCIRASQPLMIVLRIVDADEKPAMAEVSMAMERAKKIISASFAAPSKQHLLTKVMDIIEGWWANQMGVKLYGAALFLNPSKFFYLKREDRILAGKQRAMFNDVVERMVTEESLLSTICSQVDDYENMRNSFASKLAIKQHKQRNPLDWWNAYGVLAPELQSLANRIVSLCCSSSGCERNWSTFEFIHTKKRNRLVHKRLNDLVYFQYNRKIANRFQKWKEEGDKFNPLIIEDFQWNNEWVDGSEGGEDVVHPGGDLTWSMVDEAIGASSSLEGRNLPRRARLDEGSGGSSGVTNVYTRQRRHSTTRSMDDDLGDEDEAFPNDDEDIDDDEEEDAPSSSHGTGGDGIEGHGVDLFIDDDI